jgi:hypothetical protein
LPKHPSVTKTYYLWYIFDLKLHQSPGAPPAFWRMEWI